MKKESRSSSISPVAKRLQEFIKSKGLTDTEFQKICGFGNGYINSIRKSIKIETFKERISPNFPELNMNWVLTGEGEMLEPKEVIKSMDIQNVVIGFILNEIAEIKSTMKGTFYSDEKASLLTRIAQIDKMKE